MKKSRNISIFILFFAMFTSAVYLLFGAFYTRVVTDIVTGSFRDGFTYADVGDDGKKYLLEYYDDTLSPLTAAQNKLRLVIFDGTVYSQRNLRGVLPPNIKAEQFFAGQNGTVMISFYERREDLGYNYVLYCLEPGAVDFKVLIDQPCGGTSFADARRSIHPSSISGGYDEDNNYEINMFIKKYTGYYKYNYKNGELLQSGGFVPDDKINGEMIGGIYVEDLGIDEPYSYAFVSFSDGTLYADSGYSDNKHVKFDGTDFYLSDIYVDKKSGSLYQMNIRENTNVPRMSFDVSKLENFPKILTSFDYGWNIASYDKGGILAVYDYKNIRFAQQTDDLNNMTGFTDYTQYMPNTRIQSALIMLGTVVMLFLLSYAFYYLLCVRQRLYFPIVIRNMISMSVWLVLFITLSFNFIVRPFYSKSLSSDLSVYAESILRDPPDGVLPVLSKFNHLNYYQLYNDDGVWRVQKSNNYDYTQGFSIDTPKLRFLKSGINPDGSFKDEITYKTPQGARYVLYKKASDGIFVLVADEYKVWEFHRGFLLFMYCSGSVIIIMSAVLASRTSRGINRVAKGVGRIATSDGKYKIVQNSCDELQSFALTVNNFAGGIYAKLEESRKIRESYLKFIPYHILDLMDIDSAAEADITKVAARSLTLMSVRFRFLGAAYQNPEAFFDNINELMAAASKIISKHGGAVYNTAHDRFDAVFGGEVTDAAASAVALRQEVIAINKNRARAGLFQLELCAAIEKGDAIMGFVDSDAHVVPAIVSTELTLARAMIKTAISVGANIICSDEVACAVSGYSVRYIGKMRNKGMRVYELFDGDTYRERTAKEKPRRLFAEGLQKFYGRDFSGAKRVFMDIVHKFPEDNVNRHYLYLADMLEKDNGKEVYIDYGSGKDDIDYTF